MGRHKGIPEEQRLCLFCDLGVVEDKFHFVFHRPLFNDLRSVLLDRMQGKNLDLFWATEDHMLRCIFLMEISSFLLNI